MALAGCPDYFLRHSNYQEGMDRTSSRRPEELIVPGFQRSANQNLPHHHEPHPPPPPCLSPSPSRTLCPSITTGSAFWMERLPVDDCRLSRPGTENTRSVYSGILQERIGHGCMIGFVVRC
ncbi:hypothetical protein PAMP_007801 [Pampus punctatissimus]